MRAPLAVALGAACVLATSFSLAPSAAHAQSFEERTVNVGNMGLNVTNVGTIGRPNVRSSPQGPPSMEYPLNSGIEHLFEGGLWIGALQDGQIKVSTATIDDASGYSTGKGGFEMTPAGAIIERSSDVESPLYSSGSISQQDIVSLFTDKNTIVPGTTTPIADHLLPLGADVKLETYAWNFAFADYFVILNYTITNNSPSAWDSAYVSMWTDLVVRNVNVTNESGSAFFSRGGVGYLDSLFALYAFHAGPASVDDYLFAQSYGASQFLGAQWRGQFFHPSTTVDFNGSPLQPRVNPTHWIYRNTWPTTDLERYQRQQQDGFINPDPLNGTPANRVQLLSVGPFPQVAAGESINVTMAMVCARRSGVPETAILANNLGWARRTYYGEDRNRNGLLDGGEDLNGDNLLTRFVLPSPPNSPKTKLVADRNKATLYWNDAAERSIDPISQEMDFEGYRIYRTNTGDDRNLDFQASAKLVAQFDLPANETGINNGFGMVRLANPVNFDGDTVTYTYAYEVKGLLDGWQYGLAVTAFDRGDSALALESLESSFVQALQRVVPGMRPTTAETPADEVGVYPNPYSISAAWDGPSQRTRKVYFTHLPARATIQVFTLAGDIIATLEHDAGTYNGSDAQWFINFGDPDRTTFAGGEHAWDILSDAKQSLATGLYLVTVTTPEGTTRRGRFAIIK